MRRIERGLTLRMTLALGLGLILGFATAFAVSAGDASSTAQDRAPQEHRRETNLEALEVLLQRVRDSSSGQVDLSIFKVASAIARRGEIERARTISQTHLPTRWKPRIEWEIAWQSGDPRAMRKWLDAHATRAGHTGNKVRDFKFYAYRYFKLGDLAKAHEWTGQAFEQAKRIIRQGKFPAPIRPLVELAIVQAKIGDLDDAGRTLKLAAESEGSYKSEYSYLLALRRMITAYGFLGDAEQAGEIAERINQYAWTHPVNDNENSRQISLNISLEWNAYYFAKGRLFGEALASLNRYKPIYDGDTLEHWLTVIAKEQAKAGLREEALRTFDRALETMRRKRWIGRTDRIDAMIGYAENLVEAGEHLPPWFGQVVEAWFDVVAVKHERAATDVQDVVTIFVKAGNLQAADGLASRYTVDTGVSPYIRYGSGSVLTDERLKTEVRLLAHAAVWLGDFRQALALADILKAESDKMTFELISEIDRRDRFFEERTKAR